MKKVLVLWILFVIITMWATACQKPLSQEDEKTMKFVFRTAIPCILPAVKADNQPLVFPDFSQQYAAIVYPYIGNQGDNTDGMDLQGNVTLNAYQVQFYGARGLRQGSEPNPNYNSLNVRFDRFYEGGGEGTVTVPWIDEEQHEVENLFKVQGSGSSFYRPIVVPSDFRVDTRLLADEYLGQPATMMVYLTVTSAYGAE